MAIVCRVQSFILLVILLGACAQAEDLLLNGKFRERVSSENNVVAFDVDPMIKLPSLALIQEAINKRRLHRLTPAELAELRPMLLRARRFNNKTVSSGADISELAGRKCEYKPGMWLVFGPSDDELRRGWVKESIALCLNCKVWAYVDNNGSLNFGDSAPDYNELVRIYGRIAFGPAGRS